MAVFSSSPWLFVSLAAAGLCLTYFLYRRGAAAVGGGFRRVLAALSVAAWLGLAGLAAQPFWVTTQVTYHPPLAILAVDRSVSFDAGAALGAEAAVRRSREGVRRHYADQGFQIREVDFAETAAAADAAHLLGSLSNLESLRRYLDSADLPNLQGIFVWTDGRFNLDTGLESESSWPAPLFPVAVWGNSPEVQGEHVDVDLNASDSGAEGNAVWRPVGRSAGDALLELRSGSQILWRENLPRPADFTGAEVFQRFHLPESARGQLAVAALPYALIRPARGGDNSVVANDTVAVHRIGMRRGRNLFLRPLQSLEERGLIDALYATETMAVTTVDAESLAAEPLQKEDVIWVRDDSPARDTALRAAAAANVPTVIYSLPTAKAARTEPEFSGDARVTWSDAASGDLPSGVVRLADLGDGGLALPAPDSSETPVAWAEEKGKRGLLLAAVRSDAIAPVLRFSDPPLWEYSFRPDPDARVVQLQRQWVAGVLAWIRRQRNGLQVQVPGVLLAHRKFFLAAASGSGAASAARAWEMRAGPAPGVRIAAMPGDAGEMRFGPLDLPAGSVPIEITDGARVLWRDTLRVRDPEAVELSRLGIDVEGLTRIAAVTQGSILRDTADSGGGEVWRRSLPELPRGQTRTESRKSFPLVPVFWITLLAAACLSAVWALRKKLQLD